MIVLMHLQLKIAHFIYIIVLLRKENCFARALIFSELKVEDLML